MSYIEDLKSDRGVIARIVKSSDGGPLRTILAGCASRPTGTFISTKADYRDLPWESKLERATMQLCEVSHRVAAFLSQPHRLEISVQGRRAPLVYFPDFNIRASRSLCEELKKGESFAISALRWQQSLPVERELRTVIIEVKSERDSRLRDHDYNAKLNLARRIYNGMGYYFFVIQEKKDLGSVDFKAVKEVVNRRHALFSERDVLFVAQVFERYGGSLTVQLLEDALGGGPASRAKIFSMHVRGIVSIDLQSRKGVQARVAMLRRYE